VNPDTREFVYVPIPEEKEVYPGYEKPYKQFEVSCQNLGANLPRQLVEYKSTHLDPDFSNLTYGDEKQRGKPVWGLKNGDIVAFYASLRPIPTKPCGQKLIYAMIGLYVVDKVIPAEKIPEKEWDKNAHTRRNPDKTDIVVFAKSGLSGRLEQCILIGEFRDKAYRVTHELLDKWGGLSVKNGWIQRSAKLPCFHDPERFYEWFKKQNIGLVARNN
jgi:hypothetical protein